jgi:serine/threonine protein kinase
VADGDSFFSCGYDLHDPALYSNVTPTGNEGGFGSILLITLDVVGPLAAKKSLRTSGMSWAERFESDKNLALEAEIMHRIGPNPYIVPMFAAGFSPIFGYAICMQACSCNGQHVQAGYFTSAFERGLPFVGLSTATFFRMATDAASGLSFVHWRGYNHHDVKPGNILVVRGGAQDGTYTVGDTIFNIYLCDFGLAKEKDETFRGGTDGYIPPECITVDGNIYGTSNECVDVYALGVMFRSLMTGEVHSFVCSVYIYGLF